MSSSSGMEEYYQKVIQLQERLRQSEEERLKLEMKFNEMLQVMKEEEEAHFKKLRTKYKQFLEEDRRRQQRNDKILEALDRIENRAQIWEAKTEKFKVVRRKYQDYLKHASGHRSRSPLEADKPPAPKYDREPSFIDRNPKVDPEDAKNDIMEKYLQSLSSPKCKEDIIQRRNEKPPPESKYSNLGNINSVYWKNPRTSEKADLEKEDDYTKLKNTKDLENALKQNSNAPSSLSKDYNYSGFGKGSSKYMEKENDDYLTSGRKPYDDFSSPDRKLLAETQSKQYNYTDDKLTRRTSQQLADNEEQMRQLVKEPEKSHHARQVHNDLEKLLEHHKDEAQNQPIPTTRNNTMQQPTPAEFQSRQKEQFQPMPQLQIQALPKETNSSVLKEQIQSLPREQTQPIPRQPVTQASREISSNLAGDEILCTRRSSNQLLQQLEGSGSALQNGQDMAKNQPLQQPVISGLQMNPQVQRRPSEVLKSEINVSQLHIQKEVPAMPEKVELRKGAEEKVQNLDDVQLQHVSNVTLPLQQPVEKQPNIGGQQYDTNGQSMPQYDDSGQPRQEYDANEQQYYDNNEQQLQQHDENGQTLQQYDQNKQPSSHYDENGQPSQQYDEHGQLLQQLDEHGQPLQQVDENGQPLQQYYNENEQLQSQYYDENGLPLQNYDESGQPLQQYNDDGQPLQQYYDDNGQAIQQYDENGQPMPQYDENGQPLPQYNASAQPVPQYDENGQPILQYDASRQPILQYDENGQPLNQYDPNAQMQYDQNGQPVQYDENGQPIVQYDENGQPMIQYDENGQPIVQYDENGQPLIQYDQNGQPLVQYDQSGQPLPQFDENGQPLTQYDQNGQPLQYYDENGQPVQYYEGEAAQQYDENGQLVQQYGEQPQGDYYEEQQDLGQHQQGQEQVHPEADAKPNILDILETDTESAKQDTKISNDSDFDFSNG